MSTARYRNALPQLDGRFFLTDAGLETSLIFNDGVELPDFAAFQLLRDPKGAASLEKYFRAYPAIAARHGAGLILETATWRASADWGERLGYSAAELAAANRRSVELLEPLRGEFAGDLVISGCVGPRGDGYVPARTMSAAAAAGYHRTQVEALADAGADLITAITMNYVDEAIGVARAARDAGMPVVISFTVETNGKLPTGDSLGDAIARVDDATAGAPAYYMLNCAHPEHFEHVLRGSPSWAERLRGLRANASRRSHAELNELPDLDSGDPAELGGQYAALARALPRLNVLGGCCGTDERHIAAIAAACEPVFKRR